MSKNKIVIPTIVIVALMFVLFLKKLFLVHTAYDTTFFIWYAACFIILIAATYMFHFRNEFVNLLPPVILCVGTLVALIMYKDWNDSGYYLNPDDVESIVHRNFETGEETNYDDKIEEIIEKYNEVDCIKDWNNLGDVVGYEEILYIELKDGTKISIEPYGFVNMSKKGSFSRKYKISEEMEYFVE